ncbi:MAG: hypothetical protein BWY71_01196 [Planctomycetes bacterium ADurb.Bin412]|nr:MAG: hypothetical protein BWY71_01196 [Planctomycetes bacterium ADurb.Bin412]
MGGEACGIGVADIGDFRGDVQGSAGREYRLVNRDMIHHEIGTGGIGSGEGQRIIIDGSAVTDDHEEVFTGGQAVEMDDFVIVQADTLRDLQVIIEQADVPIAIGGGETDEYLVRWLRRVD